MNEKEMQWCDNASAKGGSFVKSFAYACLYADEENFSILLPILKIMMEKYPKYGEL